MIKVIYNGKISISTAKWTCDFQFPLKLAQTANYVNGLQNMRKNCRLKIYIRKTVNEVNTASR